MFNNKKVIGVTGVSTWSPEVAKMVVEKMNSIPVFVDQDSQDGLEFIVSQIDGLILAGGVDIFPGTYGQHLTDGNGLTKFDIRRDKREMSLIKMCIEAEKPIFGICRGLQMLGVYHGFPLYPHISSRGIVHSPGDIRVNLEDGGFMHYITCVDNEAKKFLSKDGADIVPVNSYHHQAIWLGEPRSLIKQRGGLKVVAQADTSEESKYNLIIAEVMESLDKKIIACQFHPEADWMYGNEASNAVIHRFMDFVGIKIDSK